MKTTVLLIASVAIIATICSCSKGGSSSTNISPTTSGHILRGSAGDSVILDDTNSKITYGKTTYSYTAQPSGGGYALDIKYSSSTYLGALLVYGSPLITFQPTQLPSPLFKSAQYTGK